jgi:hypothetical protein
VPPATIKGWSVRLNWALLTLLDVCTGDVPCNGSKIETVLNVAPRLTVTGVVAGAAISVLRAGRKRVVQRSGRDDAALPAGSFRIVGRLWIAVAAGLAAPFAWVAASPPPSVPVAL